MFHPVFAAVEMLHLAGDVGAEVAGFIVAQVVEGFPNADADALVGVLGAADELAFSQSLGAMVFHGHAFVVMPFKCFP